MSMTLEQVRDRLRELPGLDRVDTIDIHEMADAIDAHIAQPRAVPDGWKLAMWVLQSDLYRKLPEEERAVCEALVAENPYIAATPSPGESE